jgi:hypothetical protein
MTEITREERQWLLRNIALALIEQMGVAEPPVPVEEMLRHPPELYQNDFGIVELSSTLWDATFARPLSRQGNVFVRRDLADEDRRYALARETLCALITSRHGRALGLDDIFMPDLRASAEYFARALLTPAPLVRRYRKEGGKEDCFAQAFGVSNRVASQCWVEAADQPI